MGLLSEFSLDNLANSSCNIGNHRNIMINNGFSDGFIGMILWDNIGILMAIPFGS